MEASTNIASKGSLAWPGDLDLLNKYGVPMDKIADELTSIFIEVKKQNKERIENQDEDTISCGISCKLDKYTITGNAYFQDIKKIECAYCHQMFENKIDCKIKNNLNKEELFVSDIMEHLVREHGDLGDSGSKYRITPTRVCKTFELGDTYLSEDDPLFEVAKYSNWTPAQIKQKKTDDVTLKELNITSKQVAERIKGLIKLGEMQSRSKLYFHQVINDTYKIDWSGAFGFQNCPLDEVEVELPCFDGKITNLKTNTSIPISNTMIRAIEVYGYFAREGTENRIDPKIAYEVLDLSKEIEFKLKI